jgi:hypothetical protein
LPLSAAPSPLYPPSQERRQFSTATTMVVVPISVLRVAKNDSATALTLLRPSACSKPVPQLIESVNDILESRLDLELHGSRTIDGVITLIAQRPLALTADIVCDKLIPEAVPTDW